MAAAESGVRELHRLLMELDSNRERLTNGPRRILDVQAAITRQEATIDATKVQLQELQKLADQKNLQFKTNQQKVVDQKSKLGMCKNNTEYEILSRQIAGELAANEKLEVEYLELLVQIDGQKAKLVELGKALDEKKASLAKTKADVAAAEPGLREMVAKYEGLCEAASNCIPAEHRAFYLRVVTSKGADVVATVVDSTCEGCCTSIPPQASVDLRMGKFVMCRSCGRFLYLGG